VEDSFIFAEREMEKFMVGASLKMQNSVIPDKIPISQD